MSHGNEKHGHTLNYETSITYNSWRGMLERCNNPNNKAYKHYGGRGIKVCKAWKDFEKFLTDVGERPSKKHSISRIDNDGDYKPGNCKWSTQAEQLRNYSRTVFVEVAGERMVLKDACAKVGVKYETAVNRRLRGLPLEKVLFTGRLVWDRSGDNNPNSNARRRSK